VTTILDARGNPIKPDKPALSEDIALAHTTSVRNPRPNTVASTITPMRLAGLLRSVVDGNNPQDYMTLAEEIEERDLHYASVLRTRKLAVAAQPPSVEAASDDAADQKMADEVRKLMDSDQIPELFFDLLDGLGKGMGVCQILWDTSRTPWVPKDYKWVDPRYLRPDAETLSEILLISDDAPQGKPLEPYKFIVHLPRTKSGSIWRNGLTRLCAVMYMLKSFTIRDWWAFAEVFGIPIRVGKYGPNATVDQIATLKNAIATIASDSGAIIPDSMMVELVETAKGNGGDTLFESMVRWCNEEISKATLGQTMTTENGSSRAQATVHNEVRLDIAKWDARQLESTINEYLVKPFIILNWGVQQTYPRVCIRVPEPEDLKVTVESLMPLIDRGMRISESEMRDKFGFADPKTDEAVLKPLTVMEAAAVQPLALNRKSEQRQQPQRLAINRIQQPNEQAIEQLTEEAMSDWVEVGGDDFMNPIIELAAKATTFDEFSDGLLKLQENLTAEQFTPQLADYLFRMRGMGDVQDA
jgi:phage gp29-like protein